MEDCNELVLKRLQKLKKHNREPDLKLKLNLFIRVLELKNVHEACRRMGFGRTFYYKWWNRFKKSGFKIMALKEKSRRPKFSPKKTPRKIELKIREYKAQQYGALMIYGMLQREKITVSIPTIQLILNSRKKIPRIKKKRLNPHDKRYELPIPGQRLQMDVKYVPHQVEGRRAYTYVAVDECTRWRFAYSYHHLDADSTVHFLDMLKQICPFPIHCIQTDNGFEFTNKLHPNPNWDHPMKLWCGKNEIAHRLIPPGVKELNGKVERSHRIDAQYFYWKATDKCLQTFNEQLAEWIEYYNKSRPHYGLKFMTPLEKLDERFSNLRQEVLPKEQEWIRNKFYIEAPVKMYDPLRSFKMKLVA